MFEQSILLSNQDDLFATLSDRELGIEEGGDDGEDVDLGDGEKRATIEEDESIDESNSQDEEEAV